MWSWRLWITFRVSLHMIWGYLGPVSPDDHNAQIHVKQVNGNLQLTLTEGHSLIWCEMWSWRVLITLRVSLHMTLGHLAPVSQICPNARLPQNRYNSTLKLPWQRSKASFEWKTKDYFLCSRTLELRYLGSVSSNCSDTEYSLNRCITWI